jgi:hypothetical protein
MANGRAIVRCPHCGKHVALRKLHFVPAAPLPKDFYPHKCKTCDCGKRHITLKEFNELSPYQQGYFSYMQAAHSGSELRDRQANTYLKGTQKWEQFQNGQQAAVLEAQDSEE